MSAGQYRLVRATNLEIIERVRAGESIEALAKEYGRSAQWIYRLTVRIKRSSTSISGTYEAVLGAAAKREDDNA